jgi:beta-galactosidase
MVPHAGTDTKIWREVCDLGAATRALAEVQGSTVAAEVAIVVDHEAWWACSLGSHPTVDVRYPDQARAWHAAFVRAGITVDVVPRDADLSRYRVVVAPTFYLVDDLTAAALAHYAENGGHVDAKAVASCQDGPLPGRAAITRRDAGEGAAWYVATRLDGAGTAELANRVATEAGVTRFEGASREVEIVRRIGTEASYMFVVNHSATEVAVPASGVDLLTGARHDSVAAIPAGGVVAIREEKHDHD